MNKLLKIRKHDEIISRKRGQPSSCLDTMCPPVVPTNVSMCVHMCKTHPFHPATPRVGGCNCHIQPSKHLSPISISSAVVLTTISRDLLATNPRRFFFYF